MPQSAVVSVPVRPGDAEADSGPVPWPVRRRLQPWRREAGQAAAPALAAPTPFPTAPLFPEEVNVLLHHFFSYSQKFLPVIGP